MYYTVTHYAYYQTLSFSYKCIAISKIIIIVSEFVTRQGFLFNFLQLIYIVLNIVKLRGHVM